MQIVLLEMDRILSAYSDLIRFADNNYISMDRVNVMSNDNIKPAPIARFTLGISERYLPQIYKLTFGKRVDVYT